jgi:tetratricopeptide (TPR) repeat protein
MGEVTGPSTAAIRQYLTAAYSDEEITAFCTDHFRPAADGFTAGMTKGQKIQLFLDRCQHHEAIAAVIRALEQDRPAQFKQHFGAIASSSILPLHTTRPPVLDFTGRSEELRELVAHLSRDGATAAISGIRGMGGIGKTELALAVAQALVDRYPDACLMFELQPGNTALTPEALLGTIIHAFQPELRLPDGLAELQGLYRSMFAGKRGLLLLDNAAGPEQVRPLLPPPTGWGVLVTSRSRFPLPGALLHDLELLPLADAVALLHLMLSAGGRHDLTGADGSPGLAADLVSLAERCGHLPLALRLAAGFLTTYIDWSLPDYLAALDRARLAHLTAPGEASVQAVMGLSVDRLRTTDVLLAQRWAQLAVFHAPFDRMAAAAVWGQLGDAPAEVVRAWPELVPLTEEETRQALSALVQQSLVDYDASARLYELHDLLRECAAADPTGDLDTARLRHAWHYLRLGSAADGLYQQGGAHVVEGLQVFRTAWPHLWVAWRALQSRKDRVAWRWFGALPDATAYVLDLQVAPRDRIAILQQAATAAHTLGDRRDEGAHLGALGRAYAALGEVRRAVGYYEQALAINREIGDRRMEGVWLGNLGNAYAGLGEVRRAVETYEQALFISREIGDQRNEGNCLGNLGLAYSILGEVRRAVKYHEQALGISRDIGDRRGEGNYLGNLGDTYATLGKVGRAIELFEQALAISQGIGDRHMEGDALGNLGAGYYRLGEMQRAVEFFDQALAISRELDDRRSEGNALGNLGLAYTDLGEGRQALAYFEQALAISRETGDRRMEGHVLSNLGATYYRLGEVRQAIESYEQALYILRVIGDRSGEGDALGNLGAAYYSLGRVPQAMEYQRQALAISREIGNRRDEATWLGNLGLAYADQGEIRQAIPAYEQALIISREIGNRRSEGNHLANLADAYYRQGEVCRAVETYAQALAISRAIGDRRGEGNHLVNMGLGYEELGDTVRAHELWGDALRIFEEIESPHATTVRGWLAGNA